MKQTLRNLKSKNNRKNGFTLMEMLIVVAIIAILVAVSIPMFTAQLDRARTATDLANQRSARAVAAIRLLTEDDTLATGNTYHFDAASGTLGSEAVPKGYGKCKKHKNAYIDVTIAEDGGITMAWVGGTSTEPDTDDEIDPTTPTTPVAGGN